MEEAIGQSALRGRKLCTGVLLILLGVTALSYLYVWLVSVFCTSRIDPAGYYSQHILIERENGFLQLPLALCLAALILLLCRFLRNRRWGTGRGVWMICGALAFIAAVCVGWIFAVELIPSADSRYLLESSYSFSMGDYSPLRGVNMDVSNYYLWYPFQLGIAFIFELVQRAFGRDCYRLLALWNVISLIAAYAAILYVTEILFRKRFLTCTTAVLLCAFLPPMLSCTYLYGLHIGFSFAAWAAAFAIRYFFSGKKRFIAWTALCMAAAILAKPNYWIFGIAIVILVLLYAIGEKRASGLVMLAALLVLPTLATYCVKRSYELRGDVRLGPGIPQTAWLVMGLMNDSARGPGWFNGYNETVYSGDAGDISKAKEKIALDLGARVKELTEDPPAAWKFFLEKTSSQWDEPTFESVYITKKKQLNALPQDLPALTNAVYNGRLGTALETGMRYFTPVIYLLYVAGLMAAAVQIKKQRWELSKALSFCVLPLVTCGGFGYQLLFEAKSLATVLYPPLMMPCIAYGLCEITNGLLGTVKLRSEGAASSVDNSSKTH